MTQQKDNYRDHDNSYKEMFSHARPVRELLQGFVKEDWVDKLDFKTLERVNSHYTTDDIRSRESDIVWGVRLKGTQEWAYIYLLLEFQSTIDKYMRS